MDTSELHTVVDQHVGFRKPLNQTAWSREEITWQLQLPQPLMINKEFTYCICNQISSFLRDEELHEDEGRASVVFVVVIGPPFLE